MLTVIAGVFLILHGLVHLLYFGQSRRLFELQPGMTWPEKSWILSKWLSPPAERHLANVLCIIGAALYMVAGIAFLAGLAWWKSLLIFSVIFSSLIFIAFWNGHMKKLHDQGAIGILINVVILVLMLLIT